MQSKWTVFIKGDSAVSLILKGEINLLFYNDDNLNILL